MGKEECLEQGQNHQRPAYKLAYGPQWGRRPRGAEIEGDERKAMPVPHSSTAAGRKAHAGTQITAFSRKGRSG